MIKCESLFYTYRREDFTMISYKTQFIFYLISLTYLTIIEATHGTLSPRLEFPSRIDDLFRRHMATQTLTQVADRFHPRPLTSYTTITDNLLNRSPRSVSMFDLSLFHEPQEDIQPYRRIKHYTINKWEDLLKLLQALRRKCVTNPSRRSFDTSNITSRPSRVDGNVWTREIKRSSVDIDRHIEVTNQRLFLLRKRPSGLAPPARDWCRLIGYSVCPRGVGT